MQSSFYISEVRGNPFPPFPMQREGFLRIANFHENGMQPPISLQYIQYLSTYVIRRDRSHNATGKTSEIYLKTVFFKVLSPNKAFLRRSPPVRPSMIINNVGADLCVFP